MESEPRKQGQLKEESALDDERSFGRERDFNVKGIFEEEPEP